MAETHAGAGGTDVIDILTTDHQEMLELIGQIESSPDAGRRRDLADTLIAEVMRHAVAEEMYVYPAIKKHVPNGAEEVESDKKEHDEIVRVMKRMEDADAAGTAFMDLVRQLEEELRHHIDEEESDQFPRLRLHIPAEDRADLGEKVQNAKRLAPTRPHPHAPHAELFHKTVGPGVGMIDRLRDRLTGRTRG